MNNIISKEKQRVLHNIVLFCHGHDNSILPELYAYIGKITCTIFTQNINIDALYIAMYSNNCIKPIQYISWNIHWDKFLIHNGYLVTDMKNISEQECEIQINKNALYRDIFFNMMSNLMDKLDSVRKICDDNVDNEIIIESPIKIFFDNQLNIDFSNFSKKDIKNFINGPDHLALAGVRNICVIANPPDNPNKLFVMIRNRINNIHLILSALCEHYGKLSTLYEMPIDI